jgi:nucleotide-binding universal stress UspA family protein
MRRWSLLVVVAAAVMVACGDSGGGVTLSAEDDSGTALEAAFEACQDIDLTNADFTDYAVLQDAGESAVVDGVGEDDGTRAEQLNALSSALCLLDAIGAPDHVISRMESTRALDGRQSAEIDDYELSWSYHPDSGMDLIVVLLNP